MNRPTVLALCLSCLCACTAARTSAAPPAAGAKARNVTFISTSDSHYKAFESEGWNEQNRETIDQINRVASLRWPDKLGGGKIDTPRGVLLLGDCIDDGDKVRDGRDYTAEQYKAFLADFGLDGTDGVLKFRVYETWGNHDGPPIGKSKQSRLSFQAELEKRNARRKAEGRLANLSGNGLHYSWDWDDVHLVSLGIYPADRQNPKVRYNSTWHDPQGALTFLKQDLARCVGNSGRPVVLMSHCGFDTNWWHAEDWQAAYQAAKKYNVVLYLYGHTGTGLRYWAPEGQTKKWTCINDGHTTSGFFIIQIKGDRVRAAYRCKEGVKVTRNADRTQTREWGGQWGWKFPLDRKIAVPAAPAAPAAPVATEDRFEIRNVEGWTVYINRDVAKQYPEQYAKTLEHLRWELYQIKLAAPARAVSNMQENNAIWIEYREKVGLSYHPSRNWLTGRGYKVPRDPQSFMSLSAKTHVGDSYRHPFVIFHELAHGYDFHFIGKGRRYGNDEAQANYERMMKTGKYEKVKIWHGRTGSHYGRSNRMEYWAESTEAYFAVNDIYPFVRAELREHDPQMARFVERYWGVEANQIVQLEKDLAAYQQQVRQGTGRPKPAGASPPAAGYTPTAQYQKRKVKGWAVYVSPRLVGRPGLCETMVTLLTYKLHMINHFIAEQGEQQLHQTPIWLEIDGAGPYTRYCGSREQLRGEGANPDKFRAVEVRDPRKMMKWALLQQSDVLHELALAYYDRHAAKKDSELGKVTRAAYQQAAEAGKYKSVLRFDGRRGPHPALAGEKEYFAELMESYFLVNDHYPFIRCELKDQDPAGYALIADLWEGNPRR